MKSIAAAILFVVALMPATAASADDYERGLSAYNRAEYATALEHWQNLAVLGHPNAQFGLGIMYSLGQGVAQDHATAATWLHLAAARLGRGLG